MGFVTRAVPFGFGFFWVLVDCGTSAEAPSWNLARWTAEGFVSAWRVE